MNARRAAALLVLTLASAGCANSDPANKTAEPANKAAETTTSERSATTSQRATETSRTTRSEAASPNDERAIRRLNWREVIDATPGITIDESSTEEYNQPYIGYANTSLYGYVEIDSVEFADLDGDGVEEAFLPVWSGGTAGGTGLLAYRLDPASGDPLLVGPTEFYDSFGYKTWFDITDDTLTVTEVTGNGWEANCCWSGTVSREFRLRGGALEQVGDAHEQGEPFARSMTVERFYQFVADGEYELAYDQLSPSFQAENPFPKWRDGYTTTTALDYHVAEPESDDAPVQIVLRATDTTDGESITHTYTGEWTLTYSVDQHQWLLDHADIQLGGEFPTDE